MKVLWQYSEKGHVQQGKFQKISKMDTPSFDCIRSILKVAALRCNLKMRIKTFEIFRYFLIYLPAPPLCP